MRQIILAVAVLGLLACEAADAVPVLENSADPKGDGGAGLRLTATAEEPRAYAVITCTEPEGDRCDVELKATLTATTVRAGCAQYFAAHPEANSCHLEFGSAVLSITGPSTGSGPRLPVAWAQQRLLADAVRDEAAEGGVRVLDLAPVLVTAHAAPDARVDVSVRRPEPPPVCSYVDGRPSCQDGPPDPDAPAGPLAVDVVATWE